MNGLKTQIMIVNAGAAGLLLGELLSRNSIDNIILESSSFDALLKGLEFGFLERSFTRLLRDTAVGELLPVNWLSGRNLELELKGYNFVMDLSDLTKPAKVIYFNYLELVQGLMEKRWNAGLESYYKVKNVSFGGSAAGSPGVARFVYAEEVYRVEFEYRLDCESRAFRNQRQGSY